MKNISNEFGFYLLIGMSIGSSIWGDSLESCIFLTGAILFNAIKSIGKGE